MAKLEITEHIHFATNSPHTATSWQVSLVPDFSTLIDESVRNEEDLLIWYSKLPKPDGVNFYGDETIIYARAMIHFKETDSPWFDLNNYNQKLENKI